MSERIATTPFGGGRFSAALFQAQASFEARQKQARESTRSGGNATGKVDKWQLLRALTEAREAFVLSDRSIAVLEALMSFYPEKELDGTKDLIVFPSNQELSIRCRGMSAPTLRRHIAALIKAGLLLRRDSANGKRFARKGAGGEVQEAFGFNLAPVALLAPDIFSKAEEARVHSAALRKVRGEITLHLRDIAKMLEAAEEDGFVSENPDLWAGLRAGLVALSGRVSRYAALGEHQERCDKLLRLRADVESAFLAAMREEDLSANDHAEEMGQAQENKDLNLDISGNDAQNERHNQNSNKDTQLEYSQRDIEEDGAGSKDALQGYGKPQSTDGEKIALGDLMEACPGFADYALNGLRSWQDAREAAELARPMLGISKDAWSRAVKVMGLSGATVTMAYLLERSEEIKSAGGYLRTLTVKAEAGKFRLRPLLESLKNR